MRSFRHLLVLSLAAAPLAAQATLPLAAVEVQFRNALPPGAKSTQLVVSRDTLHVYYSDSARALWAYDRAAGRATRLAAGEIWDLTIARNADALAYRRLDHATAAQQVWMLPLDARTGLAAGPERRASNAQGDAPSFSPDGKWLAFASDDSLGVGQGIMLAPVAGGRARTLVPTMRSTVSTIGWSPDGKHVVYGVNPPVPCDPDWSCLPVKPQFQRTTGTVQRIAATGGASATLVPRIGYGWPGMSPDGSRLVYSDTGTISRLIVADSAGRALGTFQVPSRQTVEGWIAPATLVLSDRGDVRRVYSYSLNDGVSRLLVDTMQALTEPSWSPAAEMFSTTHCMQARCEYRVWSNAGALVRVIALPDAAVTFSTWSPDGASIAYVGGTPGPQRRLRIVNVSTGEVRPLVALPAANMNLKWTSDSHALIISEVNGGTGAQRHLNFRRVGLDGAERALRTIPLGATPSGGVPVDATTAFVQRDGVIHRITFDGDSSDTVVMPTDGARISGYPTLSADGKRVAIRRAMSGDDDLRVIEVFAADGHERITIETPFPMGAGGPSLRFLNANEIVVLGGAWEQETNGGLYLVDVVTKATRKLFSFPLQSYTGEISVSPDGRTILYLLNETTSPRVFTVDLLTSRTRP
jgi:Tol biopolymer transport system component